LSYWIAITSNTSEVTYYYYYKNGAKPTTENLKSSHLKLAIESNREREGCNLLKETTDTH